MCRIISFVSGKGGVGKSSIINLLSTALSENDKKVCVIDGVFSLNYLSNKFGNRGAYDISKFFCGNISASLALAKKDNNLYYVKTNDSDFDYKSCGELFKEFISSIRFDFDYILIETNSLDTKNLSMFLNLSTEVILVTTAEREVLQNSFKLVQKIKYYKNITNVKTIVNMYNFGEAVSGKVIPFADISDVLKAEVIFVFPKFLKYNIFTFNSERRSFFKDKLFFAVNSNSYVETGYEKKYKGIFGYLKMLSERKFY